MTLYCVVLQFGGEQRGVVWHQRQGPGTVEEARGHQGPPLEGPV